jgi:hypothetical protein
MAEQCWTLSFWNLKLMCSCEAIGGEKEVRSISKGLTALVREESLISFLEAVKFTERPMLARPILLGYSLLSAFGHQAQILTRG